MWPVLEVIHRHVGQVLQQPEDQERAKVLAERLHSQPGTPRSRVSNVQFQPCVLCVKHVLSAQNVCCSVDWSM